MNISKQGLLNTYLSESSTDKVSIFGYDLLDYVTSTGTQLVNTGVAETNTTTVNCDFEIISASSNYIFGSLQNSGAMMYNGLYSNSALEYNWLTISFAATSRIIMTQQLEGTKNHIIISNGNNILSNTSPAIGTAGGHNIYVFGCNDGNRPYTGELRCRKFQIFNNNIMIRNFIPVKRHNDNVPGFFDLIENKFYSSATSTQLIAGNTVSNTITSCSNLIEY